MQMVRRPVGILAHIEVLVIAFSGVEVLDGVRDAPHVSGGEREHDVGSIIRE